MNKQVARELIALAEKLAVGPKLDPKAHRDDLRYAMDVIQHARQEIAGFESELKDYTSGKGSEEEFEHFMDDVRKLEKFVDGLMISAK